MLEAMNEIDADKASSLGFALIASARRWIGPFINATSSLTGGTGADGCYPTKVVGVRAAIDRGNGIIPAAG